MPLSSKTIARMQNKAVRELNYTIAELRDIPDWRIDIRSVETVIEKDRAYVEIMFAFKDEKDTIHQYLSDYIEL